MKFDIIGFMDAIDPLVNFTDSEYNGALKWLNKNYDDIYSFSKDKWCMDIFYESLKTNPDNWTAVITYCDICIESNDINRINNLAADRLFIDNKPTIELFMKFRSGKEVDEFELNVKQKQVANDLNNNILLLASAGTGKTKTIAHRISNIINRELALPEEILCLTFTNKACKEMKERISSLVGIKSRSIVVRTFHSFCYSIIKSEYKSKLDIYDDFIIYDEEDCKEVIIELNKLKYNVGSLQNIIDYIKITSNKYSQKDRYNYKKIIQDIADKDYQELTKRCIGERYRCDYDMVEYIKNEGHILIDSYNKILGNRGALDFNDLIIKANELLEDNAVAKKWKSKFKYIQIDEVQDTNEIEYMVLSKLFYSNKILLSGDYFQTIYEWRGSNPINVFNLFINGYGPKTIVFENNYRATKTLLNAANGYLKNTFSNELKEFYVNETKAESKSTGDRIVLTSAENIRDEAKCIYYGILNLGVTDFRKIAILTRNNNYNKSLSYEFSRINENRPENKRLDFFLVEEYKFFRRQEIKDLIALIKILLNKHDENSLKRILLRFAMGIGEKTINDITSTDNRSLGISLTDFIDLNTHIYNDKYQLLINELDKANVVVFDVETTGLNTVSDEIVQIAALRMDKFGDTKDKFTCFIKPGKSVGSAQDVHGFSDEFLRENGLEPKVALMNFMKFAEGSLIVGHNVNYDLNILNSEISRLGLPAFNYLGYYDTLELARRYYPNLKNHKLQTLSEYFNTKIKSSHDALYDVLATCDVLIKIVDQNIRPSLMIRLSVYGAHLRKFDHIADLITQFDVKSKVLRPHLLLDLIIEKSKILEIYEDEPNRTKNIEMFVRIAESFDDANLSCRDSLIELLKITSLSNTELDCLFTKDPKIPIITIHQSKGTEYDFVFLAGLQDYVFPSYQAIKSMDLDEEKRLFYVAITRAKKQLFLSWSKRDTKGMKSMSKFVRDIPREYLNEV